MKNNNALVVTVEIWNKETAKFDIVIFYYINDQKIKDEVYLKNDNFEYRKKVSEWKLAVRSAFNYNVIVQDILVRASDTIEVDTSFCDEKLDPDNVFGMGWVLRASDKDGVKW